MDTFECKPAPKNMEGDTPETLIEMVVEFFGRTIGKP